MATVNYPKCEHCGQELVVEEHFDFEGDPYYASDWCAGICPKCKTRYEWTRTFDVTYRDFYGVIEIHS